MDGRKQVGVSSIERHRKQRLRTLINEHLADGGAASLARKANRTQASVSHLSLPGYPFGRRAARALEEDLALRAGYFDDGYGDTKEVTIPLIFNGIAINDDTVRLTIPKDGLLTDEAVAILLPGSTGAVALTIPASSVRDFDGALLVRCRDSGAFIVGRLNVQSGQLCLLPLDAASPPFAVHPNIEIVGRVLGLWTKYPTGTEQSTTTDKPTS